MKYLQYLRNEYKAPDGRALSEKSVKHNFNILRNIFNYAEKQEEKSEKIVAVMTGGFKSYFYFAQIRRYGFDALKKQIKAFCIV